MYKIQVYETKQQLQTKVYNQRHEEKLQNKYDSYELPKRYEDPRKMH